MSLIRVNRIAAQSAEEIVEFVNTNFVKHEPLCKSMNSPESEIGNLMVRLVVPAGLSFEAIDTGNGNERVGIFLCDIVSKDAPNAIDQELDQLPPEEEIQKMGDFFDYTKSFINEIVFEQHKKNAYLEGILVSVKENYGGRGIAGMLTRSIINLASEMKIEAVYVGCTSEFTAKAVAKCGFKEIYRIAYTDYKLEDKQVFYPHLPHEAFRGYLKLIT